MRIHVQEQATEHVRLLWRCWKPHVLQRHFHKHSSMERRTQPTNKHEMPQVTVATFVAAEDIEKTFSDKIGK